MKGPLALGSHLIFSDGPEVVMTREQLAAHVASARAEGMREAARIAGRLSDEWATSWRMTSSEEDVRLEAFCDAAAAIEAAIISAIGERQ